MTESQRSQDESSDPNWRDRAAEMHPSEVLHRLMADERRALHEVEQALERIAKGTWGLCERCREAIGTQRLRAMPEARLCIDCSSEKEPEH